MAKIYIFGHRNPDTDSVCSAISLAYLKRQLGYNAVPVVLSSVNAESKYALNYFNVKEPLFLNDVKIKVGDLNYTKNYFVREYESIYSAYYKMNEAGISKIPVVDEERKILGIISMKDIAKAEFSGKYDIVDTLYSNILETISGSEVLKFDDEIKGNLYVASYKSSTIVESFKFNSNDILIVGDRHSVIEYAIKSGVKLLIVTGGHKIKDEHLKMAMDNKVNIIYTPYNTLFATKMFYLANSVITIYNDEKILCIRDYEDVHEFVNIANKTRYSYYPVLNKSDKCMGIIRLSDVVFENRKKVILVDHNTYEQSAVGLEDTDILEIIDHHNIGNISTNLPISFRNMAVGSTCTIVCTLYKENDIDIPKDMAGLMLSGILSDTLVLNSPTTTNIDREAVNYLSEIAGVNYKEYGRNMIKEGSSLSGMTMEQILYRDYKNYTIGKDVIGISQIITLDINQILDKKDEYIRFLNTISDGNNNLFVCLVITDVLKNGSYILYSDRACDILSGAFKIDNIKQGEFLNGVVSRKKQVVPNIMVEME